MAIAASGAVSFSDLRTEFVGGSSAISLGDLYRGGSNILSKAGDNPAVNLAATVPTSGTIDIGDFHSTAKGFKNTISASTTNVDAAALFGDDFDVNYPKIIDINAGVTLGGVSDDALGIPSGLAGSLTINNAGNIYGFGGTGNGGSGGSAIHCASSGVTINNTGEIRGGGGAGNIGGQGGAGGNGSYENRDPSSGDSYHQYFTYWQSGSETTFQLYWWVTYTGGYYTTGGYNYTGTTYVYNGWTHHKGTWKWSSNEWNISKFALYRTQTVTSTGGAGGAGGNGGVGQGYNQSAGTGSAGSNGAAGGTNAGTGGQGGTGGDGGSWATAGGNGTTGITGGNGTTSNGSGGAGGGTGGAAGAAVAGTSVTMNNSGTINGALA